ncbi:MAG: hypothetical protein OER90_08635, partial [Gemmatimonadota bacterium]|nr:hypothetical protein [Gemmatimonadota bacterium]
DDFTETVTLVDTLPFTYLHVFPYSERPGVASRRIGPPVHPEVTASRASELRALASCKGSQYRRRRDGERADIVILQRARGRFEGLTGDYLTVAVPTDVATTARFSAHLSALPDGDLRAIPAA